jgi:ribonuclease P protein component
MDSVPAWPLAEGERSLTRGVRKAASGCLPKQTTRANQTDRAKSLGLQPTIGQDAILMKLKREAKLRKSAEFRRVFDQSSVSKDRYFRLISRFNGLGYSRLGMGVAARTCRSAVGRNRLKRLIRESFRKQQNELSGKNARDVVVVPTFRAVSEHNHTLTCALHELWTRLARTQSSHGA